MPRENLQQSTAELNPSLHPAVMLSCILEFLLLLFLHVIALLLYSQTGALLGAAVQKERGKKTSCKSVLSLSCATRWCSSKSMNGGIRAPMEQHLGLTSDPPSPSSSPPPLSHQLKASRLIPFNLRHCSRSNASASTCPTSPCGRALRLSTCFYNLRLQVIRDV